MLLDSGVRAFVMEVLLQEWGVLGVIRSISSIVQKTAVQLHHIAPIPAF